MNLLFVIISCIVTQTLSLNLKCSPLNDKLDYPNNCKLANSSLPANPQNYRNIQKDQVSHLLIEYGDFKNLPNFFQTFPNLLTLELNWSNIENMDASSLPNKTILELLSTFESHVHHINGSFFKKAENLKNLTLTFGTIGSISQEVITGVTKGKELTLTSNQIYYMSYDLFNLITDLSQNGVNLHDNEIHSFSQTDDENITENAGKTQKSSKGLFVGISLLVCLLLAGCVGVVASFYFRRRQSEIDFNQLLSELNNANEPEMRGLRFETPASLLI